MWLKYTIFNQYRPCGFPGAQSRRLSHPSEYNAGPILAGDAPNCLTKKSMCHLFDFTDSGTVSRHLLIRSRRVSGGGWLSCCSSRSRRRQCKKLKHKGIMAMQARMALVTSFHLSNHKIGLDRLARLATMGKTAKIVWKP
jgi:hypothetical protein